MRKMGLVALSATLVAACGQMDRLEEVAATAEPLNQTVYPKDLADFYQLGQGRDVVREEVRSQCLAATSPTVPANMPASTMRFDQSVLVQEVTSKLGFDATLKSHFKILDVDAKAKMARATQTNAMTIALFYEADVRLDGIELDESKLQWVQDPATTPDWYLKCGDAFLSRKQKGGSLYLLYRIDFATAAAKSEFEAQLNKLGINLASKTALDVNASVSQLSTQFSGRAAVHVEVVQIGGDPLTLGQILGGTPAEAGRVLTECRLDNLVACGQLMSKAVTLGFDATFQSSLKTTPADKQYEFRDWSALPGAAVSQFPPRSVPPEVSDARQQLRSRFDAQVQLLNRIEFLKSSLIAKSAALDAALPGFEATANNNVRLLKEGVAACWDDLTAPADQALVAACVSAASDAGLASRGYDATLVPERLVDTFYSGVYWSTPYFSNDYTAVVTWTTSKPTTTQLRYRLKSDTAQSNPWITTSEDATLTTNHSTPVPDLYPVASYEYELLGKDQYGLAGTSVLSVGTFSRGTTPAGNFDVGIIPPAGSATPCPGQRQPLRITLVNETSRNANSGGGWIGATYIFKSMMSWTQFYFCRVDGRKFRPFVPALDLRYEYAVLQLGPNCPADSVSFYRHFDCEDGSSGTGWADPNGGTIAPSWTSGNAGLYFCMVRYGANSTGVPNLGASYGVFAPGDFVPALARGYVFTDDEDSRNANGYSSPFYGESTRIISAGSNTTLNMAQVR